MDKIIQAAVAGVLAISAAQAQNLTSLPTASVPLSGTEPVYIVQGGVSKQVPASAIGALGTPSLAGADASASNVKATGGLVARTLAARSGDVLSVLDFAGIDCTGTSDSTTGMQAAVTALAAKTLRIPGGCTLLLGSTTLPSITIIGDGDSSHLVFSPAATYNMLYAYAPGTQVYLRNLQIDGNQASVTNSAYSSVRLAAPGSGATPSILDIDNVTFTNGRYADVSTYIADDTGTQTRRIVNIRNSRFFGGVEYNLSGTSGGSNVGATYVVMSGAVDFTAINNTFDLQKTPSFAGRSGIYTTGYGNTPPIQQSRVIMANNRCINVGVADSGPTLGCFDVYSAATDVVISGNILEQPYGRGINVKSDALNIVISGNAINGLNQNLSYPTHGIVDQLTVLPSPTTVVNGTLVISGNTLLNSSTQGISLGCNNAGFTAYSSNINITGNMVSNPTLEGIDIEGCWNANISDNFITGASAYAGIKIGNREGPILVHDNTVIGMGLISNPGGSSGNNSGSDAGLWVWNNIQPQLTVTSKTQTVYSNHIWAWQEQTCVDTSSAAQTVNYISSVPDGKIITLMACSANNSLTVGSGSGNVYLSGGSSYTLPSVRSAIWLLSTGGNMIEVSRASN